MLFFNSLKFSNIYKWETINQYLEVKMLIGFIDEPGIAMVAMSEDENDGNKHPIVKAKVSFHMDEKNESYSLINFLVFVEDENPSEKVKSLILGYKVSIMRELSSLFVGSKLRYNIDGKHYHFVKKLGEKENVIIPIFEEALTETENKETEIVSEEKVVLEEKTEILPKE